jgi:hypothetical protein
MSNSYIAYLNSLNNASSSNANSIAEAQLTNPYYEKIRVERSLGKYLASKLQEEPTIVILTGHAGDGKTSLIHQILRQFDLIKENETLKKYDKLHSSALQRDIFYIKDMSELNDNEQVQLVQQAILQKEKGGSAIIVSNTGPLIKVFKNLALQQNSSIDTEEIEMKLLKLMDENRGTKDVVGTTEVLLVNLARIDNVTLVPKLIENLVSDELWKPCQNCTANQICPMYNNYLLVKENIYVVKEFIVIFYRWLFETDKRLTVRQILSHLSYSLTGNQTCEQIKNSLIRKEILFKYNFSNLFFGYEGLEIAKDAMQIRAIQELQSLNLDTKALDHDYQMFVRNDFSFLTDRVQNIVLPIWQKEMRKYTLTSKNLIADAVPFLLRKSVRRMAMLFGRHNEETMSQMINQLFSPTYSIYLKMRTQGLSIRERKDLESIIRRALYFILVGNQMEEKDSIIYLPLQRNGRGMQSVQLLLGKIDISDIRIEAKWVDSEYDLDNGCYKMFLAFRKIEDSFEINLMLLDYFVKVAKGAVSTKINPALSHGIDKIKAKLFSAYRFEEQDSTFILVHTLRGPRQYRIEIDSQENKMYIE